MNLVNIYFNLHEMIRSLIFGPLMFWAFDLISTIVFVKAHLFPSPIGLKPSFSLLSYFLYISLLLHVSVTSEKPSRHLVVFCLLSLSPIDLLPPLLPINMVSEQQQKERSICPAERNLPCRRLLALLPALPLLPAAAPRRPDSISLPVSAPR